MEGKRTARRCGALPLDGEAVLFRVWAPKASAAELVLIDGGTRHVVPMEAEPPGHFRGVADAPEGRRYAIRLDGSEELPDPCSLWQPDGPMGPSALVRPERFAWTDGTWRGVARRDLVFYELHVGTFTPEGTFDAVIPRLPDLVDLGITAVEIMPVAQGPGPRGWGYDGVCPYAAQHSCGGPHGLARLADACHAHGLALFLDAVYNHFGPEGNVLPRFGPYLTDAHKTPWGAAVNFDGPGSDGVRDFVLDNARMWLEEFHLDGLRLDAVHAVIDLGARHILRSLKEAAEGVARRTGRHVHLVAESDLNDPRLLHDPEQGGYGLDAQWSDDFHHAVHALLTGERHGYYADYGAPLQVAQALAKPYLFAWHYSGCRGRKHGAPADGLGGERFIACLQNHDQVGNRARGDRFGSLLSPPQRRLAACLLLLSPWTPLLFMGEEYGEEAPFPYFCSFQDEALIRAVREGRKREFALAGDGVPLPDAEETFASARLSWSWPDGSERARLRRLYRDLLAARREWPGLRDGAAAEARLLPDAEAGPLLELRRGSVRAFFNLTGEGAALPPPGAGETVLLRSESDRYGGAGGDGLPPFGCVVLGPGDSE
ncbi:MAG: malto-oligosyltrehalose trehalohydrolase [Gemmataceae bacterium]|nr:malto-oligosyltrehalose trehalohydrolase [Gemmataceae bacterium]